MPATKWTHSLAIARDLLAVGRTSRVDRGSLVLGLRYIARVYRLVVALFSRIVSTYIPMTPPTPS